MYDGRAEGVHVTCRPGRDDMGTRELYSLEPEF